MPRWVLAVVVLISLSACRRPRDEQAAPAPSSSAPAVDAKAREVVTTSARIYFASLDGQIAQATERVEREPRAPAAQRGLSNLLYVRAKHRADLSELARALELVSEAIRLDPNDAASYTARAEQLQTVHRFPAARRDLASARAHGAAASEVEAIERELDYVEGKYDTAIPAIRRAAAERRTMGTVARLALLEHDLGNNEKAERAFQEAETLIRDPNPIPVAWLALQRGMHYASTGKREQAVELFRAALRRIPGYVAAEDHLAETLHELGRDDEAMALYETIVKHSTDPEFKGALAGIYRARGRVAEADALVKQATTDYELLLAKFPEAMYWHASEFFLEEGHSPRRALDLLEKNLVLRAGAPSYVALARAHLATGSPALAKTAIDKALATPIVSAQMLWTAGLVEAALGNQSGADAFKTRARALDARIDAP
jgi:tetratricopeptide (TPR) repeat protein